MKRYFARGWPVRLALTLLFLTLLSSHLVAGLSAKYIVRDHAADSARPAALSFNLSDGGGSAVIDLSAIQKPGDSKEYDFNVTGGSEVSMRYWVGLSLNGSMPLECAVKRAGTTVLSTTLAQLTAAVPDDMPLTAASTPVTVSPNPAGSHAYTLTVTWPSGMKNLDCANNSVAELTLQVLAEQVN